MFDKPQPPADPLFLDLWSPAWKLHKPAEQKSGKKRPEKERLFKQMTRRVERFGR